jgi:hypothetical protein
MRQGKGRLISEKQSVSCLALTVRDVGKTESLTSKSCLVRLMACRTKGCQAVTASLQAFHIGGI